MNKHLFSSLFAALCALAFSSSPAVGQTIVNSSFEVDASSGSSTGTITDWPFTAGSGGINNSTGPFADNGVIPDGQKVAFIRLGGTMHQVVSGFTPGQPYRLSYYENARLSTSTPNVQVTVGGVTVVANHAVPAVGGSSPYGQKITEPFIAFAANLDVAFIVSGSGDFTVLLDKVEIYKSLDVTNTNDTGPGSLRQTILDAPAGSTIMFAPGVTGTVQMYAGKITIDKNLTIVGPGSSKFILRNALGAGVDNRIFQVNSGVTAAISGLTVTGGRTIENDTTILRKPGGAGIKNRGVLTLTDVTVSDCATGNVYPAIDYGGGINSSIDDASSIPKNLTLNYCTISNCRAQAGGGVFGSFTINNTVITGNSASSNGAGLYPDERSSSSIDNSTISGNTVGPGGGGGGGIFLNNQGTVTLTNTTVSHNVAFNDPSGTISNGGVSNGGGILISRESHLILINSTVTGNTAASGGGGIFFGARASSLPNLVTMSNSIVAGHTGADIIGTSLNGRVISQGYNLIGSISGATVTGTTTGNIVGTRAAPANAKLAPLGFYGGVTQTHALLTTSPAIDAGNTATSPVADQRGAARVGTADIGAFELNNPANAGTYVAILPQGVLTVPYTYTLVPKNVAFGSTFTYTVTSGALPGGVSLTTTSNVVTLAGTPTAAGTFNFAITSSNGTISNITNYRLTVPANPPCAINPASGGALGSENVTITGTGFTGATGISIGGTPVISFTVVSDTSITAVTPAHAFGPASVVVSIGSSANAPTTLYTYLPTLFTQGQYDASRTVGQNDVTSAPDTFNLYTATQYTANYTAGQNNVINSPNTYSLYTLSQVQTLNIDVPLLVKDSVTGKFKLTIGLRKSTNLAAVPFSDFPMNGAGMTSVINAQGQLEFVFPVSDNAAFFRVQAQ